MTTTTNHLPKSELERRIAARAQLVADLKAHVADMLQAADSAVLRVQDRWQRERAQGGAE